MLTSGSVFAGYRIERVLGAGGMGTVYLARSRDLPRYDAVKVLSPELSRDPDFRARFLREAEVAAGLSHPNIVSIYSRGEFEGQLWIAMQYVDGSDADTALREGKMTPARAVHIVEEVAKALDYAHFHHVVHRDVKPANFLVSEEPNGPGRVLLGDFGIARALDDVGLTVTGSIVATAAYAAPEVLAGAAFDGRADLYSLGCTLFRLLTGKTPFSGANGMAAMVTAHLQQPPPRVTALAPNLSERFDAVIATAMAKDPARRFGSARELAEAAAAALNDRSATTAAWKPVAAAEVTAYRNVEGAGQWWQHHASDSRTAMAPMAPVPPRRRGGVIAAVVGATLVAVTVAVVAAATLTTRDTAAPSEEPAPTTTAAAPTGGPVRLTALSGLLLPPDEVDALMGEPMGPGTTYPLPLDDSAPLVEQDCVGAWLPAEKVTYTGSGFEGLQVQTFGDARGGHALSPLIQAVSSFPTVEGARRFFEEQRTQWGKCGGRTLTLNLPERAPLQLMLHTPQMWPRSVMVVLQEPVEPVALPCDRAMTLRNNVVIDVRACTIITPGVGLKIAQAIAEGVPQ